MSDEQVQPAQKKRRGRPPGKKAKRHDPDEAPIDGNEGCDRINGKDPDFTYFLAEQSEDVYKLQNRGAVVCTRDNDGSRPMYDRRGVTGEAEIKVKDLVLMKMPNEIFQKQEATKLATAKQRLKALNVTATDRVGNGLASINTNFADGGMHRQVI